jgi:hypothetical protein
MLGTMSKKSTSSKKLTPTMRVAYEGHKSSILKKKTLEKHREEMSDEELSNYNSYALDTPERYVKKITLRKDISLGEFFEKIITLSSTQGFVAFMMLYQYMYDKHLLGKEAKAITGQEIIDHIYQERSYKLKPKNKQSFLSTLITLSGLFFHVEDDAETARLQQIKGRTTERAFSKFMLLDVKGHTTLRDGHTITSITGVSIMKDFVNLCYQKLSKLYIPLEDVLKIPHDCNGDHRRGFNLALALRHAELGNRKDTVEWDLNQCLNVGQWRICTRRKLQAWDKIKESLEAGKKQELVDYEFVYKPGKPREAKYIEKVVIKRLWKTNSRGINLDFSPEEIKPKKRPKIVSF